MSQETAELLINAGHGKWCIPNDTSVTIKGKGIIQTYFLHIQSRSNYSSNGEDYRRDLQFDLDDPLKKSKKTERLIAWNVEVLSGLLRSIIARRGALSGSERSTETRPSTSGRKSMVLDEVVEVISLPGFQASVLKNQVDPDTVTLDPLVVEQLVSLVQTIQSMYR